MTIEVLHRTLSTLLKPQDTHLPPHLYVQLDNCWRENKNKYFFAYLCLLVELKVFVDVEVNFLMVGHTHEDIDQVFSRYPMHLLCLTVAVPYMMTTQIPCMCCNTSAYCTVCGRFSVWLRHHNALSRTQLHQACAGAFTSLPVVFDHISDTANMSEFLGPYITRNVPYISVPHSFLIRKDPASNKICIWTKYKGRSVHTDHWLFFMNSVFHFACVTAR